MAPRKLFDSATCLIDPECGPHGAQVGCSCDCDEGWATATQQSSFSKTWCDLEVQPAPPGSITTPPSPVAVLGAPPAPPLSSGPIISGSPNSSVGVPGTSANLPKSYLYGGAALLIFVTLCWWRWRLRRRHQAGRQNRKRRRSQRHPRGEPYVSNGDSSSSDVEEYSERRRRHSQQRPKHGSSRKHKYEPRREREGAGGSGRGWEDDGHGTRSRNTRGCKRHHKKRRHDR